MHWITCLNASETRSFVGIPLKHSASLVGFFAFSSGEPRVWSKHEIETLTGVARFAGVAVTSANERAEELGSLAAKLPSLIATIRDHAELALISASVNAVAKRHIETIESAAVEATALTNRLEPPAAVRRADSGPIKTADRLPEALTRDRTWMTSGTVLVVDDEPAIRSLLRAALERHGFEVLSAANGVEGVATFEEYRDSIRAVLLDLTMPRMGGAEAFAQIHHASPDTPVIFLSGMAEQEAIKRFENEGVAAFLRKPFQPSVLLDTLRQALESHEPAGVSRR